LAAVQSIRILPYDPLKDFAGMMNSGEVPFAVMVHGSMPVGTLREFFAHANATRES
jgi:tripartite-type tricarboxylate transporter receptor subunit TctC